ncbi:MAG: creatininase family protein, partial [Eubacteriales bacterium]|nr:creatininase family protein [Eubacteriales bacterium]
LGFKVIVPIPGHFPLIPPCRRAIEAYLNEGGRAKVFLLEDHMFADDGRAGDHAAMFETSLIMALYPELVDLNELDSDLSEPNIGVIGPDPRKHASMEFGHEILDKFEKLVRDYLKTAVL